ncbi:hypothetical protein [Pseudoroseicyclus tamaricis]|uniref:Uncharacterized protein n=1 Tax=Pseudoroseicyclus tamaricis TaxID=2705421 RepID=A0A6B2JUV8_9RHOB|nr:hypothetical protein [Pseudoroseicyclus tamaricis]NDV01850.1 hypothetical protein [Pseudoroseicyclus tamaricis]
MRDHPAPESDIPRVGNGTGEPDFRIYSKGLKEVSGMPGAHIVMQK